MKKVLCLMTLLLCACPLAAQEAGTPTRALLVDFGSGVSAPSGDSALDYGKAPGLGFSVGYQLGRHVMIDGGVECGFGASRWSASYTDDKGKSGELSDYELFIPVGAQAIFPFANDRAVLSGGGGLMFMHFAEYGPGDCNNCGSRSGAGIYEVVQFRYYLGASKMIGLGVSARFVQGSTDGTLIGSFAEAETDESWSSIAGMFSIRFR